MTYKELLKILNTMTPEGLEDDVTVRIRTGNGNDDEYFLASDRIVYCGDGVLDNGHPCIEVITDIL